MKKFSAFWIVSDCTAYSCSSGFKLWMAYGASWKKRKNENKTKDMQLPWDVYECPSLVSYLITLISFNWKWMARYQENMWNQR